MTLQHISSSFFGYNKQQIDRLLAEKNQEIQTLKDQVAAIQVKLDDYISMEQALKDGIVDARLAGNKIVTESTEEAERLLKRTNEQVEQFKEEFSIHSHDLVDTGLAVRSQMKHMQEEMLAVLASYQKGLTEMDFDALYPEDQVKRFKDQLYDFDHLELHDKARPAKKLWDVTSITQEEKEKLELLIHEVIANEKHEALTQADSKLIKFAKG